MNTMVPLTMPSASHVVNTCTNSVTWPKNVAPHLDCLDVVNAMVPLTILLVSCDADTGTNDVSHDKKVMVHLVSIIIT